MNEYKTHTHTKSIRHVIEKTHHGHDVLQTNAWFVHRFIVRMRQLAYLLYENLAIQPKPAQIRTGIHGNFLEGKEWSSNLNGLRRISKGGFPDGKNFGTLPSIQGFIHVMPFTQMVKMWSILGLGEWFATGWYPVESRYIGLKICLRTVSWLLGKSQ